MKQIKEKEKETIKKETRRKLIEKMNRRVIELQK